MEGHLSPGVKNRVQFFDNILREISSPVKEEKSRLTSRPRPPKISPGSGLIEIDYPHVAHNKEDDSKAVLIKKEVGKLNEERFRNVIVVKPVNQQETFVREIVNYNQKRVNGKPNVPQKPKISNKSRQDLKRNIYRKNVSYNNAVECKNILVSNNDLFNSSNEEFEFKKADVEFIKGNEFKKPIVGSKKENITSKIENNEYEIENGVKTENSGVKTENVFVVGTVGINKETLRFNTANVLLKEDKVSSKKENTDLKLKSKFTKPKKTGRRYFNKKIRKNSEDSSSERYLIQFSSHILIYYFYIFVNKFLLTQFILFK